MCVSSLVYWQICPSSIRPNWSQWWRILIYLAWASLINNTAAPSIKHTPTQSLIAIFCRTLIEGFNKTELHGSTENNEIWNNWFGSQQKAQDTQPLVFFRIFLWGGERSANVAFKKLLISHTDQLHGPGILLINRVFCQHTLHKQRGWVSSAINSVWLTGAYQFNMEHVHVRERGNWKAAEQWVYRFWYVMHGFEWYLQRCIV